MKVEKDGLRIYGEARKEKNLHQLINNSGA
jgi:hypothetical protein